MKILVSAFKIPTNIWMQIVKNVIFFWFKMEISFIVLYAINVKKHKLIYFTLNVVNINKGKSEDKSASLQSLII